ncbi:hypothetical protein CgunFtcFv8_021076 [Champsocephalus gunnari]|uniref:Uncharacterized protein n=1 Tax=Champsocephalus gunnari TaxID=52237 RepID=A0AAN8IFD3_CHAGU|nr:hypothetical protein CgunFtcFv8_021076 [Champsocephalus gunnari]
MQSAYESQINTGSIASRVPRYRPVHVCSRGQRRRREGRTCCGHTPTGYNLICCVPLHGNCTGDQMIRS